MKLISIYAAMTGYEQGLHKIMKIIYDTFGELGVEIEEENVSVLDIHYYDGIKSQAVENVFNKIKTCDGVIFASSSQRLAPCAIMQTFIEHFDKELYGNMLNNKNCFIISSSSDGSERASVEYLGNLIVSLGGFDTQKMAIGKQYIPIIGKDRSINEMIEKYAEDFYRILRQNRKLFVGSAINYSSASNSDNITNEQFKDLFGHEPKAKKIKAEELLKKEVIDEFNEKQEKDIDEITKIISKQYSSVNENNKVNIINLYKENSKFNTSENITPHIKTCKQRTQSLYHYFQPQLSNGLEANIQISISGNENFEGYLVINKTECSYFDGVHQNPDVTILSNSEIWLDILNGKYTSQKAFMIGQLKVKGNFVLLSKFDQLFKFQP